MKSTKSKLNVKLLRRIQEHITKEPKRLFMAWYITKGEPGALFAGDEDKPAQLPPCGTAACIAGWAILLSDKELEAERNGFSSTAGPLLGIEDTGSVFLADEWPHPFRERYRKAVTRKARAKIAVARIEHLITKGE